MDAPAIEIRGLRRTTGQFVLDEVELVLPTGYVVGLVGPNGAGKTTTIKAALGMITPDHGQGQPAGRAGRQPWGP